MDSRKFQIVFVGELIGFYCKGRLSYRTIATANRTVVALPSIATRLGTFGDPNTSTGRVQNLILKSTVLLGVFGLNHD